MRENDPDIERELPHPHRVTVQGYFIPADLPPVRDKVGVRQILMKLRQYRAVFTIAVLLGVASAAIWSYKARPLYQATALVSVVEKSDRSGGLGALANQFGGLAALAGVQLPGGNDRADALAVLRSNSLAEAFIREKKLMPELFHGRWNAVTRMWRETAIPPTMSEAIKRFNDRVRTVQEDKMTGLVKVSIKWHEPEDAARWATEFVRLANDRMRRRAIDEANKSLDYLSREADKTTNVELQQAIYKLMQAQLNEATLANVREEYSFQTLDPARAPDVDDYIWPRPAALLLFGVLFGTLLGLSVAFIFERFRTKDERNL